MTDILNIAGWIFFAIFIGFILFIVIGLVLSRNKTEVSEETTEEKKSSFTKTASKGKKNKLIVKQQAAVDKEKVIDGVFGFGNSNGFSLPPSGSPIDTIKPETLPSKDQAPAPLRPLSNSQSLPQPSSNPIKKPLLPPLPPSLK